MGTTRTVNMRGGITGDEEFLVWEPYTRMSFRFNESTTNSVAAFAEDYRVVPTAGGCHLTWIMAIMGDVARRTPGFSPGGERVKCAL